MTKIRQVQRPESVERRRPISLDSDWEQTVNAAQSAFIEGTVVSDELWSEACMIREESLFGYEEGT